MLEPEISPEAFAQLRQQPNAPLLLDVREPWEFQTASLPNSILMPMGDVPSRAHAELDPDAPIVVLCHHGARSLSVTMWLRNHRFSIIVFLLGITIAPEVLAIVGRPLTPVSVAGVARRTVRRNT